MFNPVTIGANIGWTLLSSMTLAGCQWLVMVAIARLGTAQQLGQYSLAVAITGPIVMLCRLNMRTVMVTDAKSVHPFADYFSTRLVLAVAGLLLIGVYAFASHQDGAVSLALLALMAMKAAESQSEIIYGALEKQGRFRIVSASALQRGVLLVLVVAVLLWRDASLNAALLATGLAWFLVLLLHDMPALSRGHDVEWLNANWRRMARLARDCLPTGLVMLMISVNVNLPVYFVSHALGIEQVGYYSSIASFVSIGGLGAAAASQAMAARMARAFHDDRESFWRQIRRLMWISVAVVLCAVLLALVWGGPVLALLYGPDYADKGNVLVWVALATGLSVPVAFLGLALTIARRFGHELVLTMASIVVVSASAAWLVPAAGISGAAISLVLGFATRLVLSAYVLGWHVHAPGRAAT